VTIDGYLVLLACTVIHVGMQARQRSTVVCVGSGCIPLACTVSHVGMQARQRSTVACIVYHRMHGGQVHSTEGCSGGTVVYRPVTTIGNVGAK